MTEKFSTAEARRNMSKLRDPWETSAGFLQERSDFLKVKVIHRPGWSPDPDEGWDVVLRLDGTYASPYDAEEAAQSIRQALEQLIPFLTRQINWRDADTEAEADWRAATTPTHRRRRASE